MKWADYLALKATATEMHRLKVLEAERRFTESTVIQNERRKREIAEASEEFLRITDNAYDSWEKEHCNFGRRERNSHVESI